MAEEADDDLLYSILCLDVGGVVSLKMVRISASPTMRRR
jgi:hypothetical protein